MGTAVLERFSNAPDTERNRAPPLLRDFTRLPLLRTYGFRLWKKDATNGAPGIATRSKKLLGTKGIATRVEATSVVMFGSPT